MVVMASMDEIGDEDSISLASPGGGKSTPLKRMGSLRKQPYFTNLRYQLQEQLRSLDSRVETQVALTGELQDFFRKRAEVELECSRSLDKLAKSLSLRQKELKQKRDQLHLFSATNCWSKLISETKKQSQEHAILSEIYNTQVTTRLSYVADDLQRVYKQCKEVGIEAHEELLKVLHELHTSTKTFHTYQTECKQAESKLRVVEAQKAKLELAIPKEKLERSKKIRLVDKEIQKRRNKYTDARFKALKAKNEYILCMDAANAAVQKYFVDDLSDLIECMDLGYYQCVARALNVYLSTQEQMRKSLRCNMDNLSKCINSLDSRLDKQKFLEANNSAFAMPKKFEFQATVLKGEEIDTSESGELEASGFIRQELEQRLLQLHRRLESLRTESDELWKTLETAESSLLDMLTAKDYDTEQYFIDTTKPVAKQPETLTVKLRADRHETDEFHLSKFRDYMLGTNRIARLQAKYDHIRKVLGETDHGGSSPALAQLQQQSGPQPARKMRRKRIGQLQSSGNPRLFGGSMEEFLEATNQDIPSVLRSCIRVINLYGLHHQGLFRVSGSQVEINNFKDAFERGEDPLADMNDASDINSVAGLLKLYLRELREPLFPVVYFEQFMELAQLEAKHVFTARMRDLVKSLPRSVFVVLRYLFYFLNHLSEYSDENMMDPYNIAICFGPTLVPVPEDKDQLYVNGANMTSGDAVELQVQYQNLVNDLIKHVIIYAEDIFPDDGGVIYEKFINKQDIDEGDVGDVPMDQSQDELDSEICPSEDDSVFLKDRDISLHIFQKSEFLEALAQFDFLARSKREVSFKKGDNITLYSQVSEDWWKGSVNGLDGLIPDKYIMLKIRDEDRERHDSTNSMKEETGAGSHSHHRARTSSDSFLSTGPKALSMSLSPSLQGDRADTRRLLYVKTPSPHSHLAVSGESLASSTSPESPSEFGPMEKEPTWPSGKCITRTISTPTGHVSTTTAVVTGPTTGNNCQTQHQRSLSTSDERAFHLNSSVWKEALLEEEISQTDTATNDDPLDLNTVVTIIPPPSEEYFSTPTSKEEQNNEHPTPIALDNNSAMTLNMSFSTPCSVENDDAPPMSISSSTGGGQDYFKCHGKTKSWDGPTDQPLVVPVTPLAAATGNTVSSTKLTTSHNKSKSEDMDAREKPNFRNNIQFWEMRSRFGPGHTPDLVMDLPLPNSQETSGENISPRSSGSVSPVGNLLESPEGANMTAAECFAKQNQCTLKKNHKNPLHGKLGNLDPQSVIAEGEEQQQAAPVKSQVSNLGNLFQRSESDNKNNVGKPQVKVKPQVVKKPSVPVGLQLVEEPQKPSSSGERRRKSKSPSPGRDLATNSKTKTRLE